MKKDLIILGAGLTGRILQHFHKDALILEARKKSRMKNLDYTFGTNYLWYPIPCFKSFPVDIITHVDGQTPTEESIQRYKNKIGKNDEDKSEWGLQFKPHTAGHFISHYPENNIRYDSEVKSVDLEHHTLHTSSGKVEYNKLYSTIPLNIFTELVGLSSAFPIHTIFKYRPIFVKVVPKPPEAEVHKDSVYVNYLSDPLVQPYRYCDRFEERHYESLTPMGFPHKKLYPGKIWYSSSIDTILNLLASWDAHCYGRYGSWNPNELLHETYQKIEGEVDESKRNMERPS